MGQAGGAGGGELHRGEEERGRGHGLRGAAEQLHREGAGGAGVETDYRENREGDGGLLSVRGESSFQG